MFTVRGKISSRTDLAIGVLGIALLVGIWSFFTYGGYIKPLFLPSPTGVWEGLVDFQHKDWLIPAIIRSTWRVVQALILVIAVGVPIGLLMGAFPFFDALLRKIISGGKSVPTTGILGLIIIWFAIEEKAKIVFLFMGAIFYMIVLVRQAVQTVSQDLVNVALDIGANKMQIIRKVLLPGALPQVWEAIAVCNGIMWTYIVLAEYINSNEDQLGLGYLLSVSSHTNEAGKVFATLFVVAVISALTDWAFVTMRRLLFPW